ncbi:hypothetical protein Mgra_00008374 [Meloidogyne graminicola]|uniref:Uncharacterized protein n=1 Tax=Meloidogyne graminicola TaxID=189291 RepID=A0A8S9ZFZ7_9BILA|nr:hypothetical protein Mgra_00008374 [Meloidogyne graminicola]
MFYSKNILLILIILFIIKFQFNNCCKQRTEQCTRGNDCCSSLHCKNVPINGLYQYQCRLGECIGKDQICDSVKDECCYGFNCQFRNNGIYKCDNCLPKGTSCIEGITKCCSQKCNNKRYFNFSLKLSPFKRMFNKRRKTNNY